MYPPAKRGIWDAARRPLCGLLAGLALLFAGLVQAETPATQAPQPWVLGTSRADDNYVGRLLRRTYQELFKRLGVPLEMRTMPSARLAVELAAERIDGDVGRPLVFADSHPGLVRVEEPIMGIVFGLWSVNPKITLQRLDQLAGSGLSVNFTRGVVECERLFQTLLPATRVTAVTTTVNALNMLHLSRTDLHCGIDLAVLSDAGGAELSGLPPPIKLFNVGETIPLFLYLQHKHAGMVPQIDATLKKMKAEGVLEQIRRESLADFKLAPALKPVVPLR